MHAGDGLDGVMEAVAVLPAVAEDLVTRRVSASTTTCTFAENR